MGRAPCCDKANVKRGPWSPDEDHTLKSHIQNHGTGGNWIALPHKIGLKRCGKSCRLRWLNYLRPNIKHRGFTEDEDNLICSLYISIGSRWSIIASQLPGRTDNDIKNYWNTRLRKKILGRQHRRGGQRVNKNIIRGGPQNHLNYSLANEFCPNFNLHPPILQAATDAPSLLTNNNNISFISSPLIEEPTFTCYDHSQVPNNVGSSSLENLCYSDQTVHQQSDWCDFQKVITDDYVPAFDEITSDVSIHPAREQLMDRWTGDIGCLVYPCDEVCQSTSCDEQRLLAS